MHDLTGMKATHLGVVRVSGYWRGRVLVGDLQPTPSTPVPELPPMSGKKPLAMRNCPSAVPGAFTTAKLTTDGIELTITAADPNARHEVVARAERHAEFEQRRELAPPHSGLHGGPGESASARSSTPTRR